MATYGWGKCNRCGAAHKNLMMRGPCDVCLEKEKEQVALDRKAKKVLTTHPDLLELDVMLEGFYD